MNWKETVKDLPIMDVLEEIRQELLSETSLILSAPPGAGKSTVVPIALLNEPWLKDKKIIVLEPRRLAARGVASRMAELLGESVGQTVGYRIRFETKISDQTRIEVVTEGILTRMLQNDQSLDAYGLVIFDEFHERSIHADTALAFTYEIQHILREELRILVMSATLNSQPLCELLGAKEVVSDGRQYPINVIYERELEPKGTRADEIIAFTTQAILKYSKEKDGDILVFLPGEFEITSCIEALSRKIKDTEFHALYGRLPQEKQKTAILPSRSGKRKVVLATNIAETSLTIEGIKVVIDTGLTRKSEFDSRSGLNRLVTVRISKDAADQRAGRAGRLGPGTAVRLWSAATQNVLKTHRVPEITEADLTPLCLDLAQWGIKDVNELQWLSTPPEYAVKDAHLILESLNAIENREITVHGKALNKIPTHPRIAHLLIMSQEEGLVPLATDLAALLEERDPLPKDTGTDISIRVEQLRQKRGANNLRGKLSRIEKIAGQYRKIVGAEIDNSPFDPYDLGLLIVYAFPERIAFARPGNNAQFQLANGAYAMVGHKDDLAYENCLAVANLNAKDHGVGRIFLAAPLNPKDLAPFVKEIEVVDWNNRKGGLVIQKETRIGSILLKTAPLRDVSTEKLHEVLLKAVEKSGEHLLNFDERTIQWQNRVESLRIWNEDETLPNVSTTELLRSASEWLTPYLNEVRTTEDLQKIDLHEVFSYHFLSHEERAQMEALVPEKIAVPSGSLIPLEYQTKGKTPVLKVRLQEVFGLKETPHVNAGKQPVLMHLLSPGFKLVQITGDLESFWKNAYFDVRKELRIRYKKHAWPEDPTTHEPLRGAKPRKK